MYQGNDFGVGTLKYISVFYNYSEKLARQFVLCKASRMLCRFQGGLRLFTAIVKIVCVRRTFGNAACYIVKLTDYGI